MSTVRAFAATATLTGESVSEIRPEYASMAVVWVPESARTSAANDEAPGIDAWARHAARGNGFGASEFAVPESADLCERPTNEVQPQESLVATLCRLASGLVR